MRQTLDGAMLAGMIIHATASIHAEKQRINELNVFPVPDGDTGTNMSLTIATAAAELKKKPAQTVGEVAAINAGALLRGARGNSGVILSLLFRGFAKVLKDAETMDGRAFAEALSAGVETAYKAMMKPTEGTILTVSRLSAQRAAEAARKNSAVEFVLEEAIQTGHTALADTVNQNPVLKRAGVVDAGGMGFLVILQGMLDELRGIPAPAAEEEDTAPAQEKADFSTFSSEEIRFGYCTEFICSRDTKKDPEALRGFLNALGDSLVLVDDDEIIKVHVHTNHPGRVLEEALHYGALLTVKIENMRQQHTVLVSQEEQPQEEVRQIAPPERDAGFVSVCAGEGLATVFRDLGVDRIISGGQTMNPSTEDILREIDLTPARVVYVLPNNKNIIMAAQQCIPLAEGKQVVVIPTKSVTEGIAAMLATDPEGDADSNTAAMTEAAQRVRTVEVTYAARNSDYDGTDIRQGDYLALLDHQLFGTGPAITSLLEQVAQSEALQQAEFITIFYGCDVDEETAQEVLALFSAACPNAELTLLSGGQPIYYYIISAE